MALPLDYIDFHIYPINTENDNSLIGNALTIASAANCTCTTASCSSGTIVNTEMSLAATANAQSVYTTTGISYYNLLVSPADTVLPSQPLTLIGSAVSTTVNLSWDAPTDNVGVAGYNVIRNGVWIANSGDTAFQDTGFATSTTYNYQISTLSLSTVYTLPPTAPTSVMASPYSTTGITVSWSASQDPMGVNSYKIFRGASPSGLVQVATVQGTTVSYTDRNLTASTTYYYGVEATQASYVSAMSSVISGTTSWFCAIDANGRTHTGKK